jgi:hypothetical protein
VAVTAVQGRANGRNIASLTPIVNAARLEPGSLVLEISLGSPRNTELHYDPWTGAAAYWCLRSRAEFINMPWMDLDIMMLKPAPNVQMVDREDAGKLILAAVTREQASLPLRPDGIALKRSSGMADEEDRLISALTRHYGYAVISPARGELVLLALPASLESAPPSQISRKGY